MSDVVEKHLSSLFAADPERPPEPVVPPEGEPAPVDDGAELEPLPEPPAPGTVPGFPESEPPPPEPAPPVEASPLAAPEAPRQGAPPVDHEAIARARKLEIDALRRRNATMREEMRSMREEFDQLKKTILPQGEIDPAVLESDPVLKHVVGKLNAIDKELMTRRQAEEEAIRFSQEQQEVVGYAQESRAAFLKHTPAWEGAYNFVRDAYAEHYGFNGDPQRERRLNLMEHEATRQWLENGEDPALKIYEIATALGWAPQAGAAGGSSAPVAPPVVQPIQPTNTGRVRRVREAVGAPSPTTIGQREAGRDMITREQFFEQYEQPERIRIFNSHNGEDIFEGLMKNGQIPVSMLEGSPR